MQEIYASESNNSAKNIMGGMPIGKFFCEAGLDYPVKHEAVIFDLDGTLLDSLGDLADSMNIALVRLDFPTHPIEKYRYFVGDGIHELARRVLPANKVDDTTIEKAVTLMSVEYDTHWNIKTGPYPGVVEMLDQLTEIGLRIAVLSNKPDFFTKMMVPELLPSWTFSPLLGARPGVPIKPDPHSALEIANIWGIDPAKIVYVGDTSTDMRTANAAGMYAVGVAWGFRPVTELLQAGARAIIHHPTELLQFFED